MRPLQRRDVNKEKFSEGARLLWCALEELGLTQTQVERELGLNDTGQVNRLLYGERKPGRELADKLTDRFKIPAAAWDQTPTVEFVPPAARTGTEG